MIHPSLSAARRSLRVSHPFIAQLADKMRYKKNMRHETMMSDNKVVHYNSVYLDTLTDNEAVFALSHLMMLGVFNCLDRCGDRDLEAWNIACGYAINAILVDEKIGDKPAGCLHNKDYNGLSSDDIYKLIIYDFTASKVSGFLV